MKTRVFVLTLCLAAPISARAQSHVYTNADLGRPLPEVGTASPEILAAMAARQFSAPPQYPEGPIVFVIGDGRPTAGPWEWPPEAFIPIQPLSFSQQYGGDPFYGGGWTFPSRYGARSIRSRTIAPVMPSVRSAASSQGAGPRRR
ncbi:MAG TPA: hypothetical protein VGG73_03555 [Vicinamibacterales bacterium]|jgi:hypothetical protein